MRLPNPKAAIHNFYGGEYMKSCILIFGCSLGSIIKRFAAHFAFCCTLLICVLLYGCATVGVPNGTEAEPNRTGENAVKEAIVVEPGTVKKIESMPGVKGGLQMRFVTDQGKAYTVFLGPKWFIENQKIKFMAGDKVQVRGKKYGSAIIATEISKGDLSMKLRNEEDGMPVWESSFPRK